MRLVHLLDVYNNIREKKIAGVGNLLSHRLLREKNEKKKILSDGVNGYMRRQKAGHLSTGGSWIRRRRGA